MIMRHKQVSSLLVVISIVVIRRVVTRRRFLPGSLSDKVDIWIVVDLVMFEVGELVHEILQRLVGRHRLPFLRLWCWSSILKN